MVDLFSSQKTNVLSNPFWYFVLFRSVFYCYFDFSKQHFTKDNNEKKSHGRRNETTLYLLLKTCWKFPNKREHQTSTSLRASSLFWGSREKSRESSTRNMARVRARGGMRGAFARHKWRACCQDKLQQLSCVLFIFMTISFDCGTLTHFAVYELYWFLLLYFHFNSDLERSEIASNRILKQIGNSWK